MPSLFSAEIFLQIIIGTCVLCACLCTRAVNGAVKLLLRNKPLSKFIIYSLQGRHEQWAWMNQIKWNEFRIVFGRKNSIEYIELRIRRQYFSHSSKCRTSILYTEKWGHGCFNGWLWDMWPRNNRNLFAAQLVCNYNLIGAHSTRKCIHFNCFWVWTRYCKLVCEQNPILKLLLFLLNSNCFIFRIQIPSTQISIVGMNKKEKKKPHKRVAHGIVLLRFHSLRPFNCSRSTTQWISLHSSIAKLSAISTIAAHKLIHFAWLTTTIIHITTHRESSSFLQALCRFHKPYWTCRMFDYRTWSYVVTRRTKLNTFSKLNISQ